MATRTIDELVEQLSGLPGATVGRGPAHPLRPDPSIASRVAAFFERHSVLGDDDGYVEFMQKYAGADLYPPDESYFASVLGFADGVTDIEEDLEHFEVDDEGFLFFADWGFHAMADGQSGQYGHTFMFDVSGDRRPGIYRVSWTPRFEAGITWYGEDFATWFATFASGGAAWRELLPTGA